jgi:uncharacterized membrane protein YvbJ
MKECPLCGVTNQPEAQRCACGFNFTDKQAAPDQSSDTRRDGKRTWKAEVIGIFAIILVIIGGVLMTWGQRVDGAIMMIVGGIFFAQAYVQRSRTPKDRG